MKTYDFAQIINFTSRDRQNTGISHSSPIVYTEGNAKNQLTTRLFPVPDFKTSETPGPMLLLRDFFLAPLKSLPTSIVAFSLSMVFLGDEPLVDFRGRRVAGTVASLGDAMMRKLQSGSAEGHWAVAAVTMRDVAVETMKEECGHRVVHPPTCLCWSRDIVYNLPY